MRVEDPVNSQGGLKLGSAFLFRWFSARGFEAFYFTVNLYHPLNHTVVFLHNIL